MSSDERLLRECIKEMLDEALSEPDARLGPFGKYVFADQRLDVPEPGEPNTDDEDDLANALRLHFQGRPERLGSWIDRLLALRKTYPGMFQPPRRAKKAYRTLTVPPNVLSGIIGSDVKDEYYDGEVHVVKGGRMPGEFGGRNFFSWTLQPDIFYGLKKDWGSLFHTDWIRSKVGSTGFVVFLSADVGSNDFLLNPDKMKKTGLAGQFAYQAEVLGVGSIDLSEVSFFYFDEDTTPHHESQLIRRAINSIRK